MCDVNNYISIAEYAGLHGVSAQAVKKKCQRKGFGSAMKIGHNWVIDKNEPFTDNRITSGQYRNWRKKDKE